MNPDNNEIISLPEAYLHPSKNLYKINHKNKSNVWNDDESPCEELNLLNVNQNSNIMNFEKDKAGALKRQPKQSFPNQMRGETPGSDARSNTLPFLGNVQINFQSIELPEENADESESDSFFLAPKDSIKNRHLFQRRSVEGADSNGEIVTSTFQPSILTTQDLQFLRRNSPAGISTPEILSNTTNTDIEGGSSFHDPIAESIRPPALGQSEDIFQNFTRKDLGSTDGEDSSHENFTQPRGRYKKALVEGCSVGSQSENTDSTNTVLDLKREPVQGCEDIKILNKQSNVLPKPNFIVGGAISPRTGINLSQKGSFIDLERPCPSEIFQDSSKSVPTIQSSPEQEESLISKISVESTHHPASTECITSPSGISVSSLASSKKLEWDSGADVGYSGKVAKEKLLTSSLSTLERIAIGNYASVLRAEPEGKGTNHFKGLKNRTNKRSYSTQRESALFRLTESKVGFVTQKLMSKDNFSLNYNKKGVYHSYHGQKSISTDEETINVKPSLRRKSKKVLSTINSLSHIESQMNHKSTKAKISKCESLIEKASSLSHLGPLMYELSDPCITKVVSDELLKTPINNHNLDNSNSILKNTLSLPSGSTFKSIRKKSIANLLESQSLDLNKLAKNVERKVESQNASQISQKGVEMDNFRENSESNADEWAEVVNAEENNDAKAESFNSVNHFLSTLGKKLSSYICSLVDTGVVGKLDDYNKLQDYINFIQMPSKNEEEVKLKKSVANIMLRMFGDITAQEVDSSSSTPNTDEITTEANLSLASLSLSDSQVADETEKDRAMAMLNVPGDKIKSTEENLLFVPYRPKSATQTYYLALPGSAEGLLGELLPKCVEKKENLACKKYKSGKQMDGRFNDLLSTSTVVNEQANLAVVLSKEEVKSDLSSIENENTAVNSGVKGFGRMFMEGASTSKGLYQDWHGTYHVAHQPPGYNSCIDSHQSESTSENEAHKGCGQYHPQEESDSPLVSSPPSVHRGLRDRPPVWSSTGSESAYETIRERHRNVGESLASSFEFYSTSPRDARLLGYVSETSPKPLQERDNGQIASVGVPAAATSRDPDCPPFKSSSVREGSNSTSSSSSSSRSPRRLLPKGGYRKHRKHPREQVAHDPDDGSDAARSTSTSGDSILEVKKQQYVQKMTRYINALEKLERALMPSCGNLSEDIPIDDPPLRFYAHKSNSSERLTAQADQRADSSPLVASEADLSFQKYSTDAGEHSFVVHRLFPEKQEAESSSSLSLPFRETRDRVPSLSLSENGSEALLNSIVSSSVNGREDYPSTTIQNSSSEKPNKTSTLRREGEKVRKFKTAAHRNSMSRQDRLRDLGHISNFRNLMASTKADGEMRPYRFILQKAQKPFANREQSFDAASSNLKRWNKEIPSKKTDNMKPLDTEKNEELKVVDSLSSEICFKGQEHFSPKCKTATFQPRPLSTMAPEFDRVDGQNTLTKKKSGDSIGSVSEAHRAKDPPQEEKRDFCQMFPSESFLEMAEKKHLSVSIQTGQSLLEFNSTNIISESVSPAQAEDPRADDKPVGGLGCCPVPHPSPLKDLEARIRSNAAKIDAAIAIFNKKFSHTIPPTTVLAPALPSGRTLLGVSDEKPRKDRDIDQESESFDHATPPHVAEEGKQRPNVLSPVQEPPTEMEVEEKRVASQKSKKPLKFTVSVADPKKRKETGKKSLVDELVELNKENEIMTLQEALSLARPSYLKASEERRLKICRKQAVRKKIQIHNQQVMAELPDNLKTPKILQKFMYRPEESPIFSYRAMRRQNQRLYQLLPEARTTTSARRKAGTRRTNQILANFYSKKLKNKALKGVISHAHREVVTPLR